VTPDARREAVAHLRAEHAVSERRACQVLGAERSMVRYRSRRGDDAAVRARLRALAAERRRFGYRRLGLLLAREGVVLNHKKLRRLYGQEKLQVPDVVGASVRSGRGCRWCRRRVRTAAGAGGGSEPPLVAGFRVGRSV